MSDDRVAYELGSGFRPTTSVVVGVGLAATIAIAAFYRRFGRRRAIILSAAILALLAGVGMVVAQQRIPPDFGKKTHEHADLAIMIDGAPVDLTGDRFQSKEGHVRSDVTHLHDGNGSVVHAHAEEVTWGYFFWTIGLPLRGDCMLGPDGVTRCASGANRWVAVVDGQVTEDLRNLRIRDLDRVLLWYGAESSEEVVQRFEPLVTRDACIASKKCPERGAPPVESCGS